MFIREYILLNRGPSALMASERERLMSELVINPHLIMEEMIKLQEIFKDEPGTEVRLEILSTEEDSNEQRN